MCSGESFSSFNPCPFHGCFAAVKKQILLCAGCNPSIIRHVEAKPLMPAKHTGFGSGAPLLATAALLLLFLAVFIGRVPAAGYPLTQGVFIKSNLPLA